jgi:hypothetical protein
LPGVISGASTRKSRDNASRIASLGVMPCASQYAASGLISEPSLNVMRSFMSMPELYLSANLLCRSHRRRSTSVLAANNVH